MGTSARSCKTELVPACQAAALVCAADHLAQQTHRIAELDSEFGQDEVKNSDVNVVCSFAMGAHIAGVPHGMIASLNRHAGDNSSCINMSWTTLQNQGRS